MPQLMITCPIARRALPTNRSLRAADFAAADLGTNTIGPCPHCGGRHTWTKGQAHLADGRTPGVGSPAADPSHRPERPARDEHAPRVVR